MNSDGRRPAPNRGLLRRRLDEARIWNFARTGPQIGRGRRWRSPATGLVGRWGLNERRARPGATAPVRRSARASGPIGRGCGCAVHRGPTPRRRDESISPLTTTGATIAVLAKTRTRRDRSDAGVSGRGRDRRDNPAAPVRTPRRGSRRAASPAARGRQRHRDGDRQRHHRGHREPAPVINDGPDQTITLPSTVASRAGARPMTRARVSRPPRRRSAVRAP